MALAEPPTLDRLIQPLPQIAVRMDRISVWVRTAVLSCSRPGEFGGGRAAVEAALRCFFAP